MYASSIWQLANSVFPFSPSALEWFLGEPHACVDLSNLDGEGGRRGGSDVDSVCVDSFICGYWAMACIIDVAQS
jgi:hypothetical protein